MPITSTAAIVAALALTGLSLLVSLARMKAGTDIGTGTDAGLLRRIRAQGNFIEYVPMGLILLGLAEYRGAGSLVLWLSAALFAAGRAAHAAGMIGGSTPLRGIGMLATYAALLGLSLVLALSLMSGADPR
jgi:uncharacterized membrane protein YecN with MAPEG domain